MELIGQNLSDLQRNECHPEDVTFVTWSTKDNSYTNIILIEGAQQNEC